MTVSSRTPEGEPNRCVVCGHRTAIDPSRPPGDAPCPACGSLLWFGTERSAAEQLLDEFGADSLDRLEAELDRQDRESGDD